MSAASEASDMVLHERRDSVLTITINRPAQKNTVDHEAAVQLAATLGPARRGPGAVGGCTHGRGRGVQRGKRSPRNGPASGAAADTGHVNHFPSPQSGSDSQEQ